MRRSSRRWNWPSGRGTGRTILAAAFTFHLGGKIENDAQFLTPAEFGLLLGRIPEHYSAFTQFLVTIDDVDLVAVPATVGINKAWKRDGNNAYYVGPTKTGAGKRALSLPPLAVELLTQLMTGRQGSALLFNSETGGRIVHSSFGRNVGCRPSKPPRRQGWRRRPGFMTCGIRMRRG